MIITRQDLLTMVADNADMLKQVYSNPDGVLKYCKENDILEIFRFYDNCRKNYNKKRSKTYINIVKEVEEPQKVLTTLSSLITQILLFSETSANRDIFLKHSRLSEILGAIQLYTETDDLTSCIDLIREIKQDVKYLECL